jgi:NADPH2:quinone reductase
MRAIAIEEFGGRDRLRLMDLPRPVPSKGEVLVRVVASGVNPVDWKIREGLLKGALPHSFPLVPGWDLAGVVDELGEGSTRLRKGDRVWAYARKPIVQWGTYAEYVALPEKNVALMPKNLLFEEAASVPLAALTAYQALFGRAAVGSGKSVLVHAGGGGVGHFAVQLARGAGARVFATAGPANQEFVLSLGAEMAIDYSADDFRDVVRRRLPEGVDVVLDAVGKDVLLRSLDTLKPGGCLVGIVDRPDPAEVERRGVRGEYVFVEPNADQLRILAGLVERAKLRPHVSKIHPLAEAARAHEMSEGGHVRGKLVLAL